MYNESMKTKIVKFIGYSGSGKTTLIEKIVKKLNSNNVRVATIKHDVHGLDIDKVGKDSYRYSEAGAKISIVSSPELTVYKYHNTFSLKDIVDKINDVDLIIIEGYSSEDSIPTIVVGRKKTSKGKTYNFFNKYMKNKKEENEKLKNIIENLNHKIYTYEGQYKGLFYFLEECLEKFFKDVEKKIREKEDDRNIYIDIQKIKKFDFSIFNDIEKYNLLILVMNYLLPLVTNNFKSNCNIKKDLFCTNLNLINRNYNQNDIYLKDKLLRKAFLDKNFKLKSDLFIENNDNFSNSIPILRKNKSIYFHGDNTILDNIIYNN